MSRDLSEVSRRRYCWGELGLTFDARASMHTLRDCDAIMARPVAALPRLAWLKLLNACEAMPGGPP
jgi:hypothetical protein